MTNSRFVRSTPSRWRPGRPFFSDIVVRVSGAIATTDLMRSLGEQSRADYARNDDRESKNSECCQWIHAGPASSSSFCAPCSLVRLPRPAPDRLDQLGPHLPLLWIAFAHVDRREPVRDLRESHRPDLTLYESFRNGMCSSRLPQCFERRVDNLAAAVIVHVGNYRLIQPRQSGVIQRFGSALGRM